MKHYKIEITDKALSHMAEIYIIAQCNYLHLKWPRDSNKPYPIRV
ncbi:Hypothetical protein DEACI_4286 [Acididesulfobacillus acetoxydans]|uniref:Uncharacterized protein n=1 Tax=Acididesulfobacillus acetoxydans TaxID=1561005 RepID=A0A8S0WAH6_9FIRM|nr:hypothetical protein [Acididesulfobacillus acetoxydans]CAA7603459.1 Hypothetical protein DEACI_4286 [Acididesulfobacillus acetoxydans]CEJ06838.1 Hypothetical protein DEACI_1289 [Acididesulfobacillus acetoxydans]